MTFVTRFAPSPTGYLHEGHAFSALTAHRAARAAGGRFILRIEDIDRERCRAEYETAIFEDLAWLGLDWDELVRRQSQHMDDYEAALDRLRAKDLLYRCFRTRRDVLDEIARAPHEPVPPFRGAPLPAADENERLAAGEPFAWRLSLERAKAALGAELDHLSYVADDPEQAASPQMAAALWARPDTAGDVVLARKGLGVAYHLACVIDDGLQGVTHVIRGEDLRDAVHIQRLLQALLGLPTPVYRHHPLLTGPDGKRLSKRDGARSLRSLRESGLSPEALRRHLGFAGFPNEAAHG